MQFLNFFGVLSDMRGYERNIFMVVIFVSVVSFFSIFQ